MPLELIPARRRWPWALVGLILLLVGYFFINRDSTAAGSVIQNEPIRLAFLGPLTGPQAAVGMAARTAVEIAIEERNAAGGVNGRQLAVTYLDGQCESNAALAAARPLIEAKQIVALIGGFCSNETATVGPLAMQKNILLLTSRSASPSLSRLGSYFFRTSPPVSWQANMAAEYAVNRLQAKTSVVLFEATEYGLGLKETFERRLSGLGGSILTSDEFKANSPDNRTLFSAIRSRHPDMLYLALDGEASAAALAAAHRYGLRTKFIGPDSWSDPHVQVEGKKGDYTFTRVLAPVNDALAQKIQTKLKTDSLPEGVVEAYDLANLLADSLARVGTDPDKLQTDIRRTVYRGQAGVFAFDSNGDPKTTAFQILKIVDGKTVDAP